MITILSLISILIAFILGAVVFWQGHEYANKESHKLWDEHCRHLKNIHNQRLQDRIYAEHKEESLEKEKKSDEPVPEPDWERNP